MIGLPLIQLNGIFDFFVGVEKEISYCFDVNTVMGIFFVVYFRCAQEVFGKIVMLSSHENTAEFVEYSISFFIVERAICVRR